MVKNSLNKRGLDVILEMDSWLINTLLDEDNFALCICDMPDHQPYKTADDNSNTKSDCQRMI